MIGTVALRVGVYEAVECSSESQYNQYLLSLMLCASDDSWNTQLRMIFSNDDRIEWRNCSNSIKYRNSDTISYYCYLERWTMHSAMIKYALQSSPHWSGTVRVEHWNSIHIYSSSILIATLTIAFSDSFDFCLNCFNFAFNFDLLS